MMLWYCSTVQLSYHLKSFGGLTKHLYGRKLDLFRYRCHVGAMASGVVDEGDREK